MWEGARGMRVGGVCVSLALSVYLSGPHCQLCRAGAYGNPQDLEGGWFLHVEGVGGGAVCV